VRDRPEGLIRLWTLKEAFVKTTGAGLSQPFTAFSFRFGPLRIIFDEAPGNPADWGFAQVDAGPSHAVSVAWSAGQTTPLTATFVEPSELARGNAATLFLSHRPPAALTESMQCCGVHYEKMVAADEFEPPTKGL
jgi:hypothetical protein